MQRKLTTKLIWWLLPLFALRGLVPAGFMLDASHGGLSMVICSGGVYKTVQVDRNGHFAGAPVAADHASDSTATGHDSSGTHESASLCPFAVAPGAAPMAAALPVALGSAVVVDKLTDDVAGLHSPFGPARTQQSRAPPYFS